MREQQIVTADLLGRLANNLFIVGATMNYSQQYDVPWAVMPNYHHRQIYKYFKSPIFRGNHKKLTLFDRTQNDDQWGYCDFPDLGKSVKLRGFFQSYKYLDPVKDQFIKWLNFRNYPDLHDFTSIHLRLGDYLQHSDYFPPVNLDYIHLALDRIESLQGFRPEKIIVFSDDIHIAKDLFSKNGFENQVIFSESRNEYEELSRMASCRNNIIANSTFSYIGAYSNTNPDKIVITPHQNEWFGIKSKLDTKDLLPLTWHQISFRNNGKT